MKPFRKPSQMRRATPFDATGIDESPLETARKKLFRQLNTRLGWPLAAVLVAAVVGWGAWDKVRQLPGLPWLIDELGEFRGLPLASEDRYSVVVAALENDKDGVHRRLLRDALTAQFSSGEVQILLIDRTISVGASETPQDAIKSGHLRALELLRKTKASVMIWGEALGDRPEAPLRLHWTPATGASGGQSSAKYQPTSGSFDLPDLFRDDLSNVMALLACVQGGSLRDKQGTYLADRLQPFTARVRSLLANRSMPQAQKAPLQIILGDALVMYADQTHDLQALEEAVAVYQEALEAFPRERVPLTWAMAQNNLGNALTRLGDGLRRTQLLEQAVLAYQAALEEYVHERPPIRWAETRDNIGNVLELLGKRESGTTRLKQAVAEHREALRVLTREREPLSWAMAQHNLGLALHTLADRESSVALLEQAVVAFHEALQGRHRERVPLDWARTQSALGSALWNLGKGDVQVERLVQAKLALEAALGEQTRQRVPLEWARTQYGLGTTLLVLGMRDLEPTQLERSVAALEEALKEFGRDRSTEDWVSAQHNLGVGLLFMGSREPGTARLEQAVATFSELLDESAAQHTSRDPAEVRINLGTALHLLAQREPGTGRLEQAVSTYEEALRELDRAGAPPHRREQPTQNLETARKELAARRGKSR